jgi:hypothetical protein
MNYSYGLYRITERTVEPMARKEMRGALKASLEAEERAVTDRFTRADSVFADKETLPVPQAPPPVQRVIRDSFTMPSADYDLIAHIRDRCLKVGVNANKSEIVRAGLTALAAMSDSELVTVIERLERVKTGRPQMNA